MHEQSIASQNVANNIDKISQTADQNSLATRESAQAAEELAKGGSAIWRCLSAVLQFEIVRRTFLSGN